MVTLALGKSRAALEQASAIGRVVYETFGDILRHRADSDVDDW